jgi:hypothetical protein
MGPKTKSPAGALSLFLQSGIASRIIGTQSLKGSDPNEGD